MINLMDTLIQEGLITQNQLLEARQRQVGAKRPLQELLVEMGFLTEDQLMSVCAKVFNMPVADLEKETIDATCIKYLPYEKAKRYSLLPLRKEGNFLIVGMTNPMDLMALDDVTQSSRLMVKPMLCAKSQITRYIDKYYQSEEMVYDLLKNLEEGTQELLTKDSKETIDQGFLNAEASQEKPVPKLMNVIVNDAIKGRASDIHIEPQGNVVRIRYRIDGDLRDILSVPGTLLSPLVARVKIMANMDVAETRKTQDGRIGIVVEGRPIDLRISVIPTYYGEKIALRILDPKGAKITLESIGFTERELALFRQACLKPQGMILVTGPTGSGKSSTLYAALNFIKSDTKNIITVEDPIEYLISGISQIQLNPVKEVTFATSLRSILRQDPNVILIGEIRDQETAEIGFRASLTGHLVLSTLHTNSAIATITRLRDIGIDNYMISSSLNLVIAQRLVRRICIHCKEEYIPEKTLQDAFSEYIQKYKIPVFVRGKGCKKCGFTGFFERIAVFEMLEISPDIKQLIAENKTENQIAESAKRYGMQTLVDSGMEKVAMGITTLEEVARVVGIRLKEKEETKPEKIRILVVDDSALIRKMVVDAIGKDPLYECIEASNGKEAIPLAYEKKPDLVITDVVMPEMDGYALVKELKSNLATAVIPIMMLTTMTGKENELKGFDAGADDYVAKPFDQERLLARVKVLLKRK